MKKFTLFAVFWFILIGYLTLRPTVGGNNWIFPQFDKLAHFGVFGVFSSCLLLSLFEWQKASFKTDGKWWIPIASLAYGGVIELLQINISGRAGDLLDLLADGLGAFVFYWLTVRFISKVGHRL